MENSLINLSISLQDFWELEPYQIYELFKINNKNKEEKHVLEYIAVLNAIGQMFSKNYKYYNAFSKANKNKKKELTVDEIDELRRASKKMK